MNGNAAVEKGKETLTPGCMLLLQLRESKTNPRQFFDKTLMDELVASIKESGIVQPLLIRQESKNSEVYEIVDGARRYRAAKLAGLTQAPVTVRELTDEQALEFQVIANDQRVDVHPLEQCAGYQQLQKKCNYTLEQLAKHVGKSIFYVARRLKFADLIEPIRKMFLAYEISSQHAFLAARLTPEQQKEVVPWLKRGDSPQGLQNEIARHFFLILKEAPFDTADETLVGRAGSCVNCPKRTGFNKALFEDVKGADTCTDPKCFEEKVRAFIKIQVGTHKDAVLLSVSSVHDSTVKHLVDWVKAGDQNCPDTKQGVVVERSNNYGIPTNREAKLGAVIKVCTNPKCKTHRPAQPRSTSDYNSATGGSKKAEKARKIELRRRGLVFKELSASPFPVNEKNRRTVLDWAVRTLSSDNARALCQAMEWNILEAKYVGKDYHGTIEKNLAKLNPRAVEQWTYLVMLADTDLWFANNTGKPSCKNLDEKAKQEGVPLALLAKQAKEKKTSKPIEKKAAAKKNQK